MPHNVVFYTHDVHGVMRLYDQKDTFSFVYVYIKDVCRRAMADV